MEIKKAVIVVNNKKKEALSSAKDSIEWLSSRGIDVCIFKEDKNVFPSMNTDIKDVDIAIVFGGDGTVLKAVRYLTEKCTLILAINFGKVGFLSEVEPTKTKQALDQVLQGEYFEDILHDVSLASSVYKAGLPGDQKI